MSNFAVSLIFPNQIFKNLPKLFIENKILLIEEYLFFKQFNFHIQKIIFQRLILKNYQNYLKNKKLNCDYIASDEKISDVRLLIKKLSSDGINEIHFFDPVDNYLISRIECSCEEYNIKIVKYNTLSFLNNDEYNNKYFGTNKKKYRHNDFYKKQRHRLNILITDEKPLGGKFSFDDANRKKYPANLSPPKINFPINENFLDVQKSIELNFPNFKGNKSRNNLFPTSFNEAELWLNQFLADRFIHFGTYEDAIVSEEAFLNHSVISPLINTGLLTPNYIISTTLDFAEKNNIEINNVEGFIRQIIGWREFIRGMYCYHGSYSRNLNYFNCKRDIPTCFYTGTTGIDPVDDTINKINKYAYCHHIERLMIIGNFMLLCEFNPNQVYKWFMELFVDSYDWVMVPNVYGMSQFADGGLFSSKPYISSSNYIIKMSNYKKGEWSKIWDALFWSFMNKHRDKLRLNPRLNMLLKNFDRMSNEKRNNIELISENFLKYLYGDNNK